MRIHDRIFVFTCIRGEAVLAGLFSLQDGQGRFSYVASYLQNPEAHPIDPIHLPLRPGEVMIESDGGIPGAILDCCPQEWGLRVMALLSASLGARSGPAAARAFLSEAQSDFHQVLLFGSGFGSGALRFGHFPDQTFEELQPTDAELSINSLDSLAALADVLARADVNQPLSAEEQAWLMPGISLGGARPKAVVRIDNAMWIAKFARVGERVDIQRVEAAVNQMAAAAGINVAPSRASIVQVDGAEKTIFLSRRFDRQWIDRRRGSTVDPVETPIHYLSAATLLGAARSVAGNGGGQDLSEVHAQYSYMDIAELLDRIGGPHAAEDKIELFRRMSFNVLMGIRDDHLCNHGFLLESSSSRYRLSPAFDLALVPNPPPLHTIQLGRHGRVPTIKNLLSSCEAFGLTSDEAQQIVHEVHSVTRCWAQHFHAAGVSESDCAWAAKNILADLELPFERPLPSARPTAASTLKLEATP